MLLLTMAVGGIFSASAPVVHADPVAVPEGSALIWGVKESWRAYITPGGTTMSNGVTQNPDGTFNWPFQSGTYDPVTRETIIQYGGTIEFLGHCEVGYERPCALDLTISNPRVEITTAHAVLVAEAMAFTDVRTLALVELDIEAVEPLVEAGTTTWTAIPTRITPEGSEFFTYAVGTLVDPVSFSYTGDGGKPSADNWTAPGTPYYTAQAVSGAPTSIVNLVHDSARNEFIAHTGTSSASRLRVLDANFAQIGSMSGVLYVGSRVQWAYDPATRTVVTARSVAPNSFFEAHTWNGESFTSVSLPGTQLGYGGGVTWDPIGARFFGTRTTGLFVMVPGESGWTITQYPSIGASPIDVLPDGTLFQNGSIVTLPENPSDPVTLTPIPGAGSGRVVVDLTGQVWVIGIDIYPLHNIAGVWTAGATTASAILVDGNGATVDPSSGDIYAVASGQGNWIVRLRDGEELYRFRPQGFTGTFNVNTNWPARVTSDGGVLVVISGNLQKLTFQGVSPTITSNPVNQAAVVTPASPEANVTFTASATGEPSPSVRWQVRPVGVGTWSDIPGAESTSLTVSVGAEDAGSRYRAVFTNIAGEIGTSYALLSINTPPAIGEQPLNQTVAEGMDAQFKVMPLGTPAPVVQWQVLVDSDWVDITPETPGYVAEGGFLTVVAPGSEQSGTQYRAVLSNDFGTVYSNVVTLTVGEDGGESSASQTITTSVVATGALSISVSGTEVALPTPVLNGAGDALVSSGALNPVTVTDLRSANPGWNLNGQVSDFVSGSDSFSGNSLGWTPNVVSQSEAQNVVAGSEVAPGGSLGTGAGLASAGAGEGRGTAVVGAGLELSVPTNTPAGTYSATMTITVI